MLVCAHCVRVCGAQDPTYRFARSLTTVYKCTVVSNLVQYTCKLTRCIMRKYTKYTIYVRFKMDIPYDTYTIKYIILYTIYIYEVKIANEVYIYTSILRIRYTKFLKLHNSVLHICLVSYIFVIISSSH